MRRLIDLFRSLPPFVQRAMQRVGARVAIVAAVVLLGGLAAWQGTVYLKRPEAAKAPQGPTKQIATGPGSPEGSVVAQAGATLTDAQLPGGDAGTTLGLVSHGSTGESALPPSTTPPSSSYLPSENDPVGGEGTGGASSHLPQDAYGGLGNSGYGGYDPASSAAYGAADAAARAAPSAPVYGPPPTSPPSDSLQAAEDAALPPNPYRTGASASLADDNDPYGSPAVLAGAGTPSAAEPKETASSDADASVNPYQVDTPSEDTDARYGASTSPGISDASASERASLPGTGQSASPGAVRPNALPAARLSDSPYASASENHLGSLAGGNRNPYPSDTSVGSGVTGNPADSAVLAASTPGERQLEGPQQPSVVIEKHAPAEIQIGKAATFTTIVRNLGQVPAHHVTVTDHVPTGTQLADARPQPQQASDGSLVWSIGTLQPGEQTQITLELMPQAEGEIGSTAQVVFAAVATSRSISTRPQLTIQHSAPPKVLIGEPLMVAITVSNPGSGPATGVTIEEDVPDGLSHAAGAQLEYEIGTLRPGESKQLQLALKADKAGVVQNTIAVRGDGGLAARHTAQIEVVAPQLQVGVEGPKVRFLERQATYTLQIANPGTAAARDVELMAVLPRGMQFVQSDSQGHYDVTRHAVIWSLAELPPAQAGTVKLTTLPVEPGDQKLQIVGRTGLGLSATSEQIVEVKQAAELFHSVKDLHDVIEVGSETTYEIRVTNAGKKAATNVRVAAVLPAGMTAQSGEGPTRVREESTGSQVEFEPLARLNPQEEVVFKVHVQGQQAGDHIVRVQLSSDEWPTPVTREESTRVYQDR